MTDEVNTQDLYKAPAADLTREPDGGYDETHPLSPKGRFGRIRYLGYSLVMGFVILIFMSVVTLVSGLLGGNASAITLGVGVIVVYLVVIPVSVIFAIKRFHDLNRSAWYAVTIIVPIVNAIAALVLLLAPGTKGQNDYGPPPKPPGAATSIVVIFFILLSILGVLAAIAIPAYQDYVKAAQAHKAH